MVQVAIDCIVLKGNQILLGKRLVQKSGYGTWQIPGGHLEFGETALEGAKRELKEETGIDATEIKFTNIVCQARPDKHYIHIDFLVTKWNGEIANCEPDRCAGWEWFDLDKLPENIFLPHQGIIEAYKNNQNFLDLQLPEVK